MGARTRWAVLVLLAVGVAVGLSACLGSWFGTAEDATLIIGAPVVVGSKGEVAVSVANMPLGGLAAIAIDNLGITYADIAPASIQATGLNGFTVLAQDFTTTPGKGRLVAVNPYSGTTGGSILKISFDTSGGSPTFTIPPGDKGRVSLGSAENTLITAWDLRIGTAYYAK